MERGQGSTGRGSMVPEGGDIYSPEGQQSTAAGSQQVTVGLVLSSIILGLVLSRVMLEMMLTNNIKVDINFNIFSLNLCNFFYTCFF